MSRELQLLNDVVTAGRALDKARAELDAACSEAWAAKPLGTPLLQPSDAEAYIAALDRLTLAGAAEAAALQGLRDALAALDAHDALALPMLTEPA